MMTSKSKVEDKLMKKWTRWGLGIFVVAGLWVAAVSSQAAGPYYWDVNDTSGGFGTAGGTWGTSAYWNTDSTGGSGGTLANTTITTADDVNFGTGANGLAGGTVNGPASAQGFLNMTFGAASGAITLSGGTLNLAPSSTITVNNTADTISAVLQGSSSALVKEGSGKLTLSGANSYSGVTTIKAGSLSIASAVLGTNTVTLDGGELDVTTTPWSGTITNAIAVNSGGGTINASSITKVLMGSITGSGALSVKGTTSTGFLWMKDCTGYNGAMTISTGYALFQSTGTNGNAGAAFTVNATALMIDCGNSLNTIFNMGSLAGTGNIYASGYNLDAGKIKTLSVGGLNADTTFSGVMADEISGTTAKLALTKIGTGTFTLAGTNTYSGGTTISNGTLVLANRLALTNSTVTVGVTNGLAFSNDTSFVLGGLGGSYPFGLTNTANTAVALTIGANNAASVYSGAMGGGGSLTKVGSGKLTLSGTNSYSGGTTIKAGSLSIANAAFGTNTVTIDGGELDVTTTPWGGTITNAIAVNSGGGTINASSSTKVLMGSITGSGALSVKGTTSTGFLWMKDCTGYNGAMTISTGYALFQSTGTNGNAGAAFTVNATALMIDCGNSLNTIFNMGSLAGTGNIYASGYNLDAGKIKTLSVGGLNADTTFSGVLADEISGTTAKLALTKIGTGTFTLAGTNTYSGGTTVSNGALLVNGVVTGQMMVAVGGTLGGTGVVAGVVTNNGAISAGATNTTGVLTVSNLVMAANSAYFYNYDATTNDVIAVTGNLTLPTVTTVKVSRVSGAAPIANPAVLFSASSAPAGATSLDGWVVTGDVRSDSRVVIRGNQVQLVRSTGMLLEIY